ncbi:hypothetical protein BD311DRAFT_816240 [Dichomitus squalens]|uniref:Uncharacterized protein n=1 Tax=Dichomitus squalens TaxID=114155 RepID=A0A4V2JZ70_9APHY|nr:hypothetical protein BD311DRAFT_816240 [Dichomitus squalens]
MSRVSSPELDNDLASSGLGNQDVPAPPASSQSPGLSDNIAPSLPEPPALWDLTGDTDWSALSLLVRNYPHPPCLPSLCPVRFLQALPHLCR